MNQLSKYQNAFIRPSPTKGALGGIAVTTNQITALCQLTGFTQIFIETVGVGQSEIEIENVADLIIYVIPPGAGDGLQAIKKGIMEIADIIVVNKCDGNYIPMCKQLKVSVKGALSLSRRKHQNWKCPVILASNITKDGISTLVQEINHFESQMKQQIIAIRERKDEQNFWKFFTSNLLNQLKQSPGALKSKILKLKQEVNDGEKFPRQAATELIDCLLLSK